MRSENLINAATSWINPMSADIEFLTNHLIEQETTDDIEWTLGVLADAMDLAISAEGHNYEAIQELAGILATSTDPQKDAKDFVNAYRDYKVDSEAQRSYFEEQMSIGIEFGDMEMAQKYYELKKELKYGDVC